MLRVFLVLLMFSLPAAPAYADAQAVRDAIVQELREEGYTSIRVSRTLLGRMRFVAERPGARREIVVSPRTGIVLRDYLRRFGDDDDESEFSGSGSGGGQESGGGSSGSGSGDDDDENDDENDDEGDDDDDGDDDDEGDDDDGGGDDDDDDEDDD